MVNYTAETKFNDSVVTVYPADFFNTSDKGKNNGDGYGNGDVFTTLAGEAVTAGQICFMTGNSGISEFKIVDADNSTTAIRNLAVCMKTANSSETTYFLSRGLVAVDDSQITGLAGSLDLWMGARLYVDPTTSGNFTVTPPSSSGQVTRIVGYLVGRYNIGLNNNKYLIDFRPDNSYIIN